MPKFNSLKAQSGSILVGVVALTLIMTIAASGLILLNGNVSNTETDLLEKTRLQYASESGVLMGIRWLRSNPSYCTVSAPDTVHLTPSAGTCTVNGCPLEDDLFLKIDLSFPTDTLVKVTARATKGTEFSISSWSVKTCTHVSPGLADLVLQDWK